MNPGWVLYGAHQFVLVLFVAMFASRPNLRPLLIAVFIPIAFFHVSGYGCPFTRLERYYHGQNVTIINKDRVEEADRPELNFYIRNGIVVVVKNGTIADGTVI